VVAWQIAEGMRKSFSLTLADMTMEIGRRMEETNGAISRLQSRVQEIEMLLATEPFKLLGEKIARLEEKTDRLHGDAKAELAAFALKSEQRNAELKQNLAELHGSLTVRADDKRSVREVEQT
jgi:hypothetical protein